MPALADSTIIANDQGFVSVKVGQGQVRFRVQERPDGSLLLTPEAAPAPVAAAPAEKPASQRLTTPAPVPAVTTTPVASTTRDTASVSAKPASAPSAPSAAADGWLQVNREAMQLLRGRGATRA